MQKAKRREGKLKLLSQSAELAQEEMLEPIADWTPRVPLLLAGGAQIGAAFIVLFILELTPLPRTSPGEIMALALIQGGLAALLGRLLGMEAWWLPINALFVPGLLGMLSLGLPPLFWLAAFAAFASVFWGVSRNRVPLFFSSRAASTSLAGLLPRNHGFRFIDLGCGLGGVMNSLESARAQGSYEGIEAAPLPFVLSWLRARLGRRSYRVRWGDFGSLDLGQYDVVYAYLSPAAMTGLWEKASREMRAGSLLVSNTFEIPGVPASCVVASGPLGNSTLHLWRM